MVPSRETDAESAGRDYVIESGVVGRFRRQGRTAFAAPRIRVPAVGGFPAHGDPAHGAPMSRAKYPTDASIPPRGKGPMDPAGELGDVERGTTDRNRGGELWGAASEGSAPRIFPALAKAI